CGLVAYRERNGLGVAAVGEDRRVRDAIALLERQGPPDEERTVVVVGVLRHAERVAACVGGLRGVRRLVRELCDADHSLRRAVLLDILVGGIGYALLVLIGHGMDVGQWLQRRRVDEAHRFLGVAGILGYSAGPRQGGRGL